MCVRACVCVHVCERERKGELLYVMVVCVCARAAHCGRGGARCCQEKLWLLSPCFKQNNALDMTMP